MSVPREKIHPQYSPDEYLELERNAHERHEFLDGYIYAMAGESLSHSRVCINLAIDVGAKLKGKRCEALSPNMKVRTSTASLFAYPDLTIVCGEPQFHDKKKELLINPKVIFEVLSPSTERHDRTTKFQRYRLGNETLSDYLLASQDRCFVEHFSRQADGKWLFNSYSELSDVVVIDSVEIELSLSEIYDRVELLDPEEDLDERVTAEANAV